VSSVFVNARYVSIAYVVFISAFFVMSLSASEASVLKSKYYEYQKRGTRVTERYEGIKYQQIAGERLELLSMVADYRQERPNNVKTFSLGFYLAEDADVNITVREYHKDYVMKPKRSRWEKGFNFFSWDIELAKDLSIELYDLEVTAIRKTVNRGDLVPVVLFYSLEDLPKEFLSPRYRFHFVSSQRVDLTINSDRHLNDQLPRQIIPIDWEYRNYEDGRVCQLRLDAVFFDTVTGVRNRIQYCYSFDPKIFIQNEGKKANY